MVRDVETNRKTNSPDAMRLVNFLADPEKIVRFRRVAAANHRTVSQEMRHLMDRHITEAEADPGHFEDAA
jgi:hypothetical protein